MAHRQTAGATTSLKTTKTFVARIRGCIPHANLALKQYYIVLFSDYILAMNCKLRLVACLMSFSASSWLTGHTFAHFTSQKKNHLWIQCDNIPSMLDL